MTRIIFFIFIIAAIYFGWRTMRIKQINLQKKLDEVQQNRPSHKEEQMVQCSLCKLFVPLSEAVKKGDKYYCCQEHMQDEQK